MKTKLFICAMLIISLVLTTSCASTKGYSGSKLASSEVSRIKQGNNNLKIKGKKTVESAYIIKVDSLSLGSYMKGYPKHADILPGEKTIEIRHFQKWKDKSAMAGAMFGVIGASIAESSNPHTHYKLTFDAEKGKTYTIIPKTNVDTEIVEFIIVEASSGSTISPKVVQISKKNK